jgi:hypothetical protein
MFDSVPIYDGRSLEMDFERVLGRLHNLPAMHSEISPGSVAIVAYTINTFNRASDAIKSLSCNVQWVMRLSDPREN